MNLDILKQVYRSNDLRKRVLIVLLLLVIFRFLSHVPVPVPNTAQLQQFLRTLFNSNKLLGFADLFSGGALTSFSIIMMGVGPFINASIIMQLLGQAVPKLEALQKEGERGREQINKYTRWLTLPLALIQSVAMIFLVSQTSKSIAQTDLIGHPSLAQWALMIICITGGTMLLMWLGEIITDKGIGNGISLIIFAGIVARLPASVGQFLSLAQNDTGKVLTFIIFGVLIFAVIAAVVMLNEGQRNIPVSYARRVRGNRVYGGVDTHLPLRVITAGVIPIIFALAFLTIPGFIGQIFSHASTDWLASFATWLTHTFSPGNLVYSVVYFLLVVIFTYFYTAIVFNPTEIAENLQKQGGFIPGIRPGAQTAAYLKRLLNRITLAGAVGLGMIAILPFIAQHFSGSNALTFGGTGLIIIVSVAIETMKQVEALAVTESYENY